MRGRAVPRVLSLLPAPQIQTAHLTLRPPRLRDSLAVYRALRDPALQEFTGMPGGFRPWNGVGWVLRSWRGRLRGRRVDHLGFDRETGALVLCYMLFRVDRRGPGGAEVGLWMTRPFWGSQLPEEAAAPYFPAMFQALGIHRITALIDEENIPAIKVTERARRGWRLEGTLRHVYYRRNGGWRNMRQYSLLPTDWGVAEYLCAAGEAPA